MREIGESAARRMEREGGESQTNLKHLRRNNDRFPDHVALGDHHLLRHEDLRRGDLDPKISSSDHD